MAFSADSQRLFIALTEGVGVADLATGQRLAYWRDRGAPKHARELRRVQALASGNSQVLVKLWDVAFLRDELSALGFGW